MRLNRRRHDKPSQAPRLRTMLALLVCLFLVMVNLRSFPAPGEKTQRIISNLDDSLKRIHEQPQEDSVPAVAPAADVAVSKDVALPPESPKIDSPKPEAPQAEAPNADSANADSANGVSANAEAPSSKTPSLNLREDLELQDWLGLVHDGTLSMQKLEMPAYWRILGIAKDSSFKSLLESADSKVRFNDLYSSPAKNRSKLLTLDVNIRKVLRYTPDENPAGIEELYEIWAWSHSSKAWLYVFVTPELPDGLDENTAVNQSAKFAGYFYKLQGYLSGVSKPNAKPLMAPMLIGKFELTKAPQRAAIRPVVSFEVIACVVLLIVGVALILLRLFVFRVKKPRVARLRPTTSLGMPPEFIESPDMDERGH